MRTDIRKPPADAIRPAPGYIFLARRLNRHRYHMIPRSAFSEWASGEAVTLCGVEDESSDQTMPYVLPQDAEKVCQDCQRLAAEAAK